MNKWFGSKTLETRGTRFFEVPPANTTTWKSMEEDGETWSALWEFFSFRQNRLRSKMGILLSSSSSSFFFFFLFFLISFFLLLLSALISQKLLSDGNFVEVCFSSNGRNKERKYFILFIIFSCQSIWSRSNFQFRSLVVQNI